MVFDHMEQTHKHKHELIRVGKHLNEVITIKDAAGNMLHRLVKPVMVELYPRDVMQLIVGATLLSVPVAFTEEVWLLGEILPWRNVIGLLLISVIFLSLFLYYNFYRNHFRQHKGAFVTRLLVLYLTSFLVSLLVLALLGQASFSFDIGVVVKRVILVAFPASMSAAVADMIK